MRKYCTSSQSIFRDVKIKIRRPGRFLKCCTDNVSSIFLVLKMKINFAAADVSNEKPSRNFQLVKKTSLV